MVVGLLGTKAGKFGACCQRRRLERLSVFRSLLGTAPMPNGITKAAISRGLFAISRDYCLSGALRPPVVLRVTPVDCLQQIAHLS